MWRRCRWFPRRQRFYREVPEMAEVVRHVDADPRLAEFCQARFPFLRGLGGVSGIRQSCGALPAYFRLTSSVRDLYSPMSLVY
jgi:hypothetical protein